MTKDTPLVRQWTLLRLLSARGSGVTIREMAEEMQVNQKTIRRDLETLLGLAFPIQEQVAQHGRKIYRLSTDWQRSELRFTFEEAVSLFLARRFLEPLAGTPFWSSAQSAFRKIRAVLSDSALNHLSKLEGRLHHTAVGASEYGRKSEIIDSLMVGIEDRRIVNLTYQSLRSTEPVTYDIYPHGMVYHRGSLYVIAFSPEHGEIRNFKVDRMTEAAATTFPFNRDPEFDISDYMADAFGVMKGRDAVQVRIRFGPEVTRYVEESQWHPSQQLKRQGDGSIIGDFCLSHTEEIKRWVLSFGRHAAVLWPESLRAEIAAELRELAVLYGDEQAGTSKCDSDVPMTKAK